MVNNLGDNVNAWAAGAGEKTFKEELLSERVQIDYLLSML